MALGDCYRVSIVGTINNVVIVNTFHVVQESGLIGTVEGDIASVWGSSPRTNYLTLKPTTYTLQKMSVIKVSGGAPEGGDVALTGAGTRSGDVLPYQTAAVITLKTGIPGRRYRGRMYIGPLTEGDQNNGILNTTALTNLNSYMGALMSSFGSGDQFRLAVWSKKNLSYNFVTSYISRDIMGTIRRRRPGVGA